MGFLSWLTGGDSESDSEYEKRRAREDEHFLEQERQDNAFISDYTGGFVGRGRAGDRDAGC